MQPHHSAEHRRPYPVSPALTLVVIVLVLVSLAHTLPTQAATTVIYVTPGGAGDGSSWANATDLIAALNNATPGVGETVELWVAAGTYTPTTTDPDLRTATFTLKEGVAIYGGFAGTETQLSQRNWVTNVVTLSGDIGTPDDNADNSYHVVTGGVSGATLDGVTITGGKADGGNPHGNGGGVYNYSGSPILTNVFISGNEANWGGGGIYTANGGSDPILTNVTLSGNTAAYGGGIAIQYGSPKLFNTRISDNTASSGGGGGMANMGGSPKLTNVIISGNHAATTGGGMYSENGMYSESPTLTNVSFSSNTSREGGGLFIWSGSPKLTNVRLSGNSASSGGGLFNNTDSSPTLTNVVISGNSATTGGGLFNNSGSSLQLINGTLSGNSATTGGGMLNAGNTSAEIRNSILWGNTAPNAPDISATDPITITYSLVKGTTPYTGTGNLNADPLFVAAVPPAPSTGGDLRLQAASPAIDAGDNTVVTTPTDLDDRPRIVNSTVDMGAYEYQPADAGLSDLALSVGTLTPTFTPGTTSYTVTVTHSVTSITVTPTVSDPAATVTVNATPVTSGSASDPISLVVGTNPTIVKVTAADGSSGTYTITVFRAGSADVAITQTYKLGGQPAALAATTNALTLTITVGNDGPDDVAGVVAIDQFPPAVAGTGWTWICAGAACPVDSGTGDLHATLGLLPKDDEVVFTVTGSLRNPHNWRNVPAVVTPMGVVDESIGNNTVIVGRYGVFLPAIRR